jgi:hypothetical protein
MEVAHPGSGAAQTLDDHVFVLRLWLERGAGEPMAPLWRGRVKYLNTGEEVHIDGIEAVLQAVRAALPPQPSGPTE